MSNLERCKAAEWALHMIEGDEATLEEAVQLFNHVREEAYAKLSDDERAEMTLFTVFLDGED